MKTVLSYLTLGLTLASMNFMTSPAQAADPLCYEMRTYYAAPGKLEDLIARFRNHTCKLFAKHGIRNIGYWVPVENPDNKLVYIIAFPSREEQKKLWKEFMDDPEWQTVVKTSQANGKLVAKGNSLFLQATDFSPAIKPGQTAEPQLFELRTYTCSTNNLPNLLARFRDHTIKLFEKHGISNIGYWTPTDAGKGKDDTLVYILAHKNRETADVSFKNFRADPDWVKAKQDSEQAAGGPLTIKDGVKSEFMTPTDFSPLK